MYNTNVHFQKRQVHMAGSSRREGYIQTRSSVPSPGNQLTHCEFHPSSVGQLLATRNGDELQHTRDSSRLGTLELWPRSTTESARKPLNLRWGRQCKCCQYKYTCAAVTRLRNMSTADSAWGSSKTYRTGTMLDCMLSDVILGTTAIGR